MFIKTGKASLMCATRLHNKNVTSGMHYLKQYPAAQTFHTSAATHGYAAAAALPIPHNVDAAETTRFSPQRSRDISATVIMAQAPISTIDITTDNSMSAVQAGAAYDPHVQSYDCFGAVSLNSVMQSNVPTPFGGMHKFSHLNMPGGQWSQEYKFMSQNLHSSHYRALRDTARADWAAYDQNATVPQPHNKATAQLWLNSAGFQRSYSTQATPPQPQHQATSETRPPTISTASAIQPSKKEQLKRAFKEYGGTIVAFHVTISLASLGGFYMLVSSGINFVPVLEFLGIASSAIAEKVATGSTFVVAYAVHKVFAPVRISITLGATPFIVKYLRTKGFMKPKL